MDRVGQWHFLVWQKHADLWSERVRRDSHGVVATDDAFAIYVAARHGALAVENAFDGTGRRVDYSALPRITFTSPMIASAGLSEAQLLEQGVAC